MPMQDASSLMPMQDPGSRMPMQDANSRMPTQDPDSCMPMQGLGSWDSFGAHWALLGPIWAHSGPIFVWAPFGPIGLIGPAIKKQKNPWEPPRLQEAYAYVLR